MSTGRSVLVLLVPALWGCMGTSPEQRFMADPAEMDGAAQHPSTEKYLFTDSLHDIRFVVSNQAAAQGTQCRVEAVDLSLKGNKDVLQHLVIQGMAVPCPMPDGQFPAVELMDFNFDGLEDFRIMRGAADLDHPTHRYWLFDPKLPGFVPSPMLDSIQDPQFDNLRQMVSSQWYARPGLRGGSTFRYMDGRLTIVSNMEKYTEGDHERWVIWGMKDGRFQPIEERMKPLPGN